VRRTLLLVVVVSFGFTVVVTAWRIYTRPNITKEACEQIQLGMTRDEVCWIVGCEPGDYTTTPWIIGGGHWQLTHPHAVWWSDTGFIAVWLDNNGRVSHREFSKCYAAWEDDSMFAKVRRWLRL
jgi:hypothetical protein